mmetsp:Transcript_9834/g.32596  ORF Transcript_9834/g.32596 Transcript_9834/m.32596 type:complete len:324 (-) Transcript_9834:471-1442(-)
MLPWTEGDECGAARSGWCAHLLRPCRRRFYPGRSLPEWSVASAVGRAARLSPVQQPVCGRPEQGVFEPDGFRSERHSGGMRVRGGRPRPVHPRAAPLLRGRLPPPRQHGGLPRSARGLPRRPVAAWRVPAWPIGTRGAAGGAQQGIPRHPHLERHRAPARPRRRDPGRPAGASGQPSRRVGLRGRRPKLRYRSDAGAGARAGRTATCRVGASQVDRAVLLVGRGVRAPRLHGLRRAQREVAIGPGGGVPECGRGRVRWNAKSVCLPLARGRHPPGRGRCAAPLRRPVDPCPLGRRRRPTGLGLGLHRLFRPPGDCFSRHADER